MGPLVVLLGGIVLVVSGITLMDWLAGRRDRRTRAAEKPH